MQKFRHILVPTDFSPAAWEAIQVSLSLVGAQASITLMHVYPEVRAHQRRLGEPSADIEAKREILHRMERLCLDISSTDQVHISPVVKGGKVEEEVLQYIRSHDFDLIVMGVNGNGQDNEPGSHTSKVIAKAAIPVLVVPNKVLNGSLMAV